MSNAVHQELQRTEQSPRTKHLALAKTLCSTLPRSNTTCHTRNPNWGSGGAGWAGTPGSDLTGNR